jgi:putative ABC transport system permease protein
LALDLENPAEAAAVATTLGERYPDLGFQTRADVLGVIEEGIRISDVMRTGISVIALIVGAISVANTVLMSVFERTREFGVIRAVGAKGGFLFRLVLAEAICLSVVGSAAGVLVGRFGIAVVNSISYDILGLEVAALTWRLLLLAVAIALVIGLTSGLFPAARAARIPIAVALARE